MSEGGQDNSAARDYEDAGPLDDEFIPDDAWPVCMKCLKPCHPLQFYCDKCDSNDVINPLASYMPYVRIRFRCGFCGDMWRTVLYDKEASLVIRTLCLFMTIAFAPILIIVGLPLFFIDKIEKSESKKTIEIVFYIVLISILVIYMLLCLLI